MAEPSVPAETDKLIKKFLPGLIEFRRELHRHPEPGLEEFETSRRIRKKAEGLPGRILPRLLETDTVILLEGNGAGPNITLRADIDGLRLRETSGKPWASQNPGLAHACGHDGHTAILMGVYMVLSELRDRFTGSVRFVFQPGEEGVGGGRMMVEKGVLKQEPIPEAVFALHGWPGQPLGTIAAVPDANMAAGDRFKIVIKGKGGHGALPHTTVDPLLTGTAVVQGLQTIVSRKTDPLAPAVVSVCTFHCGETDNAVSSAAELAGTCRYFDPEYGKKLPGMMKKLISGTCKAHGASFDFDYTYGYIPLINSPEEVVRIREISKRLPGTDIWYSHGAPAMTAEDFSYYLTERPGAFIRLGLGENGPSIHNPDFDFKDEVIGTGIRLFTELVLDQPGQDRADR